MTLEDRFWAKVNKDGTIPEAKPELGPCWLWTASLTANTKGKGYGQIRVAGKTRTAHSVSWELVFGPVTKGLVVDHKCRNTICVNPTHLQTVTHKQNMENVVGHSSSKSGVRGVFWHEATGKWRPQVGHVGKMHYCGLYEKLEDAEQAAIALRNRLFTNSLPDKESVN